MKYKVGDRVRCNFDGNDDSYIKGDMGTVFEITDPEYDLPWPYDVKMDGGYTAVFAESELDPVEDAA